MGSLTSREVRILVTGGGTGGHVTPALAVVQALREMASEKAWTPVFLYVGSTDGVEARLARENGIPFHGVQSGKLRRSKSVIGLLSRRNLLDMVKVPMGVAQALAAVRQFRPDGVLATGGYVSVPPVIAAGILRIPALIHEQTVQVGLANRLASCFASCIALSFDGALQDLTPRQRARAVVTGNPVRKAVFGGDKEGARRRYGWEGLDKSLPVVYFTGGAQGAHRINTALEGVLETLLHHCAVIHQCGAQDIERCLENAARLPEDLRGRYQATGFVGEEIGDVYALADVVVGRSGAGTVAEAAALSKPALFIPLVPTGGDEQTRNALRSAEAGAALILKQDDLTGPHLLEMLLPLLEDPRQRQRMGQAAGTLARPEAAQEIAKRLLELIGVI